VAVLSECGNEPLSYIRYDKFDCVSKEESPPEFSR
jgi:hypothetical protein